MAYQLSTEWANKMLPLMWHNYMVAHIQLRIKHDTAREGFKLHVRKNLPMFK